MYQQERLVDPHRHHVAATLGVGARHGGSVCSLQGCGSVRGEFHEIGEFVRREGVGNPAHAMGVEGGHLVSPGAQQLVARGSVDHIRHTREVPHGRRQPSTESTPGAHVHPADDQIGVG